MTPLAGADVRIGPYRLLAELGRGGMGRVYLASGPDGRLVAVKQVDPRYASDPGFRERFRREVDASRRVSGAHTAAIIDADPQAPEPWLASVYVPGPSLQEVLEKSGPLPEEPALRLAARLASALIDIHHAGLVHRDLKPSNVLLADDGPRVIDFGVARALDSTGDADLTRTGWFLGSPTYVSPEQAQGRPVTAASDMFSFAVVLVVACTGNNPFAVSGDRFETLRNILHAQPDLTAVPRRLRSIVKRCLSKKPAQRPTPAQFLDAISPIAPSARPWPAAVHHLITQRQAEVERLLNPSRDNTTMPDPGQTLLVPHLPPHNPAPPPPSPTIVAPVVPASAGVADTETAWRNGRSPAPRRSHRKRILWLGVGGVAMVTLAAAVLIGLYAAADTGTAGQRDAGATAQPEPESSPSPEPTDDGPARPRTGSITGYGGTCMDVKDESDADRTPVQIWDCHGGANQQWTVGDDGTVRSLGKCLDVSNGDVANGTKVQLYHCNGTPAQQWTATDGQLINTNSGRCLDIPAESNMVKGTQLQIWDCVGNPNQRWQLPT